MGLAMLLVSPAVGPASRTGARGAGVPQWTRGQIRSLLEARNPLLGEVRSQRITESILRCGSEQQLRAELVLAVMTVESDMRPSALSPKGAIGLMQVMPHVFQLLELPGAIAHLESNIEAGCIVLADNIRRLGERDGISAYFWGSQIGGPGYHQRVQAVLDDLALEVEAGGARGQS